MFSWWVDYLKYFHRHYAGKVKPFFTLTIIFYDKVNLDWLKNARNNEHKELANKVWDMLLLENVHNKVDHKNVETNLRFYPESHAP